MPRICFIFSLCCLSVLFTISLSAQNDNDRAKENICGVWLHPGQFGPERNAALSKIKSTLDDYQKAGINTIIVLIKSTSGIVYYKSQIAQRDTSFNYDFFGMINEEAKKRNMIVHPWFCVFTEGGIYGEIRNHPEWLIHSKKSEMVGIVNPAIPEVRQYEISLMTEIARLYSVDWIHLDYIRYPCEPTENYYSFDPQTRKAFKEYSGEDPLLIKATDTGNILWNEWIGWNARQVDLFMRELKDSLRTFNRRIKISAAVFPDADNAKVLIGQDWELWADNNLIDMLCPMLYTNNTGFFTQYTEKAVKIGRGHAQVCIGIGIGTSHNQNTPEGMLQQIEITKKLKADGYIFFSSSSLIQDFLKALGDIK
jgi:uncharacterized lipoprotein YddW (UPF0748 family)